MPFINTPCSASSSGALACNVQADAALRERSNGFFFKVLRLRETEACFVPGAGHGPAVQRWSILPLNQIYGNVLSIPRAAATDKSRQANFTEQVARRDQRSEQMYELVRRMASVALLGLATVMDLKSNHTHSN